MIVGGIVAVILFIDSMAFTTTDRDNIRDLFGYPWSMNGQIMDILNAAFAEHGDDVVTAVQSYVVDANAIQAEIDTELQGSELESYRIEGEVEETYRSGSSQLSRQEVRLGTIKNKIRLAIDPYNQLYQMAATPLVRS